MPEWKTITGWEGFYDVSSEGEVRSWFYGKKRLDVPRIRKLRRDKDGYMSLDLKHGKLKNTYTVHRLVAKAFIPNPNNLPQINHIDGDKENNRVDNLEWCSAKDNIRHAYEKGLISIDSVSAGQRKRYKSEDQRNRSKERSLKMWAEKRDQLIATYTTDEHRQKMSAIRKAQAPPTANRRRIHNGKAEKCVAKEELKNYIDAGWSLGRASKKG